ncbi:MAG: hypothetical protein ACI8PZ_002806 [Myxococcota bacterium]|jgi:hypothetical protein
MVPHRKLLPLSCVTLALIATGCTYIPSRVLDEQRAQIDEDGDGVPGGFGGDGEDCDDNNPDIFPGAEEIAYDGLDNDCNGQDVIDADGDGFPGISREDYEANTPGTWQDTLPDDPALVDCRDDPVVYPGASQVFPGNAERRYDGIDANCGGDNDFDADNDLYMPDFILDDGGNRIDVRELFATYIAEWGYAGQFPEQFGDCDDDDDDVSPGTGLPEVAYDGIDQDCSGDNDFDQDGDGWMPYGYELEFDTFVSRYYSRDDNPFLEDDFGDCMDAADPARAPDPAAVNPGEDEVYGDGIDANCDGANDFDGDADGYMPDGSAAGFAAYAEAWGYSYPEHAPTPLEGDCNDGDPTVLPGALEVIADGTDQDCNGDDDTTRLMFADFGWAYPRSPKIVRNERHYVIAGIASEFRPIRCEAEPCSDEVPDWYEAGVALFFDPNEQSSSPEPSEPPNVFQGSLSALSAGPLGDRLDMDVADGEAWVAVSYQLGSGLTARSWLAGSLFDFSLRYDEYLPGRSEFSNTTTTFHSLDIDLVVDDGGDPWVVSCGVSDDDPTQPVLQLLRGVDGASAQTLVETELEIPEAEINLPITQCYFRSDPATSSGVVEVCGQSEDARLNRCMAYEFRPLLGDLDRLVEGPDEVPAWFDEAPYAEADYVSGWHVFLTETGVVDVYSPSSSWSDVLRGETVRTASVAASGPDLFVVAVTVDDEVLLAYGDPEVGLDTLVLPVERDGVALTPVDATVYADDARLVVAVAAGDDSDDPLDHGIGWAFFGL